MSYTYKNILILNLQNMFKLAMYKTTMKNWIIK
jgi:hypothetical protein